MLTPEQKALRLGKVTSSLVAAAVGRSKKKSPLYAYCKIVGEPYVRRAQQGLGLEVTGAEEAPDLGNVWTWRGDDFEPVVLRRVAKMLGCEAEPAPFVAHPDGWSGDSTDALFTDVKTGVVTLAEAKTVSPHESDQWGAQMTDAIPLDYKIQCRWHLLHHPGTEVCWVPFLGGFDFAYRIYCVQRDAEAEQHLWEQAHEFYRRYVEPRVLPPVTAKDTEYLQQKHPFDNGKTCEPTDDIEAVVEEVCKWRDRRDQAEDRYHEASNVLRQLMGDYAASESARFKISYRNNKDSTKTDWEALARACGCTDAQIAEHTVTKPGPRMLRVTGRGDLKKAKDKAKSKDTQ